MVRAINCLKTSQQTSSTCSFITLSNILIHNPFQLHHKHKTTDDFCVTSKEMATLDKVLLDADTNDEFIRRLMGSVVLATKESNALPQGSDFEYRSMTKEFRDQAGDVKRNVTSLLQDLCGFVNPCMNNISDDMADSALYDQVIDVIDSLLESADRFMDKEKGSKVAESVAQSTKLDKQRILTQNVQILPKPQQAFIHEIDNSRTNPFRPRLTVKHHAKAPLENDTRHLNIVDEEDNTVGPDGYFPHPYELELRTLEAPLWCTDAQAVLAVHPTPTYSQLPFTLVDTEAEFEKMLRHLEGKSEVALDLEHHALHTFQGLTCLLQVCTAVRCVYGVIVVMNQQDLLLSGEPIDIAHRRILHIPAF